MTDNPYWTVDYPNGWTGEELQALEPETQKEVLSVWFLRNFEDPAQSTPHDSSEGGYQYVRGGPYNADEELWSEFEKYGVSEELINEVVAEVTADGTFDWAPTHRRIADRSNDVLDDVWYPLPISRADFLQPSTEPAARTNVIERVDALDRRLRALEDNPPVVGSNKTPWTMEAPPFSPEQYLSIEQRVASILVEAKASQPDPSSLDEDVSQLKRLAIALGRWLKDGIDEGRDAFFKVIGGGLGVALLGLYEELVGVCQAVLNWVATLV